MTVADDSSKTKSSSSSPAGGTAREEVDVLVIGSGVSGSSLSFTLHKNHPSLKVLTTESRPVVGGNVMSRRENGYVWEEGPNTFQPAPHIIRMAVDLGLKDDLVLADSTLPRFVYWDEVLHALPLAPTDIPKFRLLSPLGFIRAGLGALGFIAPPPPGKEESVKEFISRHLGPEVFAKMIDPFVSGVYAGDPSKLAMRAAFKRIHALQNLGFTRGILDGAYVRIQQKKKEAPPPDPELPTWKPGALGSFKNGLLQLPEAVKERLGDRVRTEWKLEKLYRDGDGYKAIYETPEGKKEVFAKSIALTSPAGATAGILEEIAPGAKRLRDIYYPTVWSITLAYPKSEFKKPLRGFGNLIPRSMGIRTLGTIWSSCLFPGRAPEGMELLLSYIGGAQDLGIKDLSEDEVVAAVDKDIKKILLKDGSDVKPVVVGARRWERAIPQYNIGHIDLMEDTEKSVEGLDGLFLGGNYTSGVAFGDCVLWGIETAPKIAEFIEQAAPVQS